MSDTKVYQFGTEGNASLNALLPFLQQKGIDPAILYNMGGNNGGFFGNNGFESIIALIIVAALFGNNNGNGIFVEVATTLQRGKCSCQLSSATAQTSLSLLRA